jgi:hypothetical protein
MAEGDYREQALALRDPECVDWESDDLLSWYFEELKRRGVNPEDETVEDVEVDPELVSDEDLAKFGAGAEVVDAPRVRFATYRLRQTKTVCRCRALKRGQMAVPAPAFVKR